MGNTGPIGIVVVGIMKKQRMLPFVECCAANTSEHWTPDAELALDLTVEQNAYGEGLESSSNPGPSILLLCPFKEGT